MQQHSVLKLITKGIKKHKVLIAKISCVYFCFTHLASVVCFLVLVPLPFQYSREHRTANIL